MRKLFTMLLAVLVVAVIAIPKVEAVVNYGQYAFDDQNNDWDHVSLSYYISYGSGLYGTTPYSTRIADAFDDWKKVFAENGMTLSYGRTYDSSSADIVFKVRNNGWMSYYGATRFLDTLANPVTTAWDYSHHNGSTSGDSFPNSEWTKAEIFLEDYMMHKYCDAAKTTALISHEIGHFFGFQTESNVHTRIMDIGDRNAFSGQVQNKLYESGFYSGLSGSLTLMYFTDYNQ